MVEKNQKIGEFTVKEFILIVIIGIAIWRIPQWVFGIKGVIISGLLPIIGFGIGYLVVKLSRKFKNVKNKR